VLPRRYGPLPRGARPRPIPACPRSSWPGSARPGQSGPGPRGPCGPPSPGHTRPGLSGALPPLRVVTSPLTGPMWMVALSHHGQDRSTKVSPIRRAPSATRRSPVAPRETTTRLNASSSLPDSSADRRTDQIPEHTKALQRDGVGFAPVYPFRAMGPLGFDMSHVSERHAPNTWKVQHQDVDHETGAGTGKFAIMRHLLREVRAGGAATGSNTHPPQ
jgi:hypothetical protein